MSSPVDNSPPLKKEFLACYGIRGDWTLDHGTTIYHVTWATHHELDINSSTKSQRWTWTNQVIYTRSSSRRSWRHRSYVIKWLRCLQYLLFLHSIFLLCPHLWCHEEYPHLVNWGRKTKAWFMGGSPQLGFSNYRSNLDCIWKMEMKRDASGQYFWLSTLSRQRQPHL